MWWSWRESNPRPKRVLSASYSHNRCANDCSTGIICGVPDGPRRAYPAYPPRPDAAFRGVEKQKPRHRWQGSVLSVGRAHFLFMAASQNAGARRLAGLQREFSTVALTYVSCVQLVNSA